MIKICIFIPTFNRSSMLAECLTSINMQSIDQNKILVVISDNHSTDDTKLMVERFASTMNIFYSQTESNIGGPKNWNRIKMALDFDYVVHLSDDDLLSPDFLNQAFKALEADPVPSIFCGGALQSGAKHAQHLISIDHSHLFSPAFLPSYADREKYLVIASAVCPTIICGSMFRSKILKEFDEVFPEDYIYPDWWLFAKLSLSNDILISPWPASIIRLHGANGTMFAQDKGHKQIGAAVLKMCADKGIDVKSYWKAFEAAGNMTDEYRLGIFNCYPELLRKQIIGKWRPITGFLDRLFIPGPIKRIIRKLRHSPGSEKTKILP